MKAVESEIQALIAERDDLKQHCLRLQGLLSNLGHPAGHFYSPVVDVNDPFAVRAVRNRLAAPLRAIEIGSGFSSRLLLDTNERFFADSIDITLIDPSLDTLDDLNPTAGVKLLSCPVQEVPLPLFAELEANHVLFIDSSHVSKTGSDVNFYLFQILPLLKPGVLVHIHDIFWPFEYLPEWVLGEKRSWNEAYLLQAFLQYNDAFEILYWNNFVFHSLAADLSESMPLCLENEGGSIWLRRLATAS